LGFIVAEEVSQSAVWNRWTGLLDWNTGMA